MEIDKNTPANFSETIEINAAVDKVYRMISDVENWPSWNPDVKKVKLEGPLQPKTRFVWKAGPGTITSTLEAVEPNKSIAWTGKTMGIYALHIWKFEAKGSGTVVTTAESWDGLLPRLLKRTSRKILKKDIAASLKLLKQEAEKL